MQQVIGSMHGVARLVFAVVKSVFSSVPIIHLPAIRDEAFQNGVLVTTGRKITLSPNWLRSATCRDIQVGEVAVNGSAADAEQLTDFGYGLIPLQVERFSGLRLG